MSEPQLRVLTSNDHDALLALWREAGLTSLRPEGRDGGAAFARQLEAGQVVLGLEDEGLLIGAVVATHDGRKGWINRLAVLPAHRRRGYATRLNRAAEAHLRRLGLEVLAVLVEGWNASSLAFYEKEGYVAGEGILYLTKRTSPDA